MVEPRHPAQCCVFNVVQASPRAVLVNHLCFAASLTKARRLDTIQYDRNAGLVGAFLRNDILCQGRESPRIPPIESFTLHLPDTLSGSPTWRQNTPFNIMMETGIWRIHNPINMTMPYRIGMSVVNMLCQQTLPGFEQSNGKKEGTTGCKGANII